jgi:DNA-binding response OmpR family regulator
MAESNKLVPELIWIDHNHEEARWSVEQTLCIGRRDADINIPVDAVSRRHAKVHVTSGCYEIEDLNSRNGSAVNGTLLNTGARHALRDGDLVLLAGMVELKFTDPLATPLAPRIGRLRGVWIDDEKGDVWIDAKKLHPLLSAKQQVLLELVYQADGSIVSRDQIISTVWDYASPEGISNDAVDSLIKRLRKRLSEYTDRTLIELVRDKGVRLLSD